MLIIFTTMACTGGFYAKKPADTIPAKNFIIVTTKAGDTLDGLAETYLGDRRLAWRISSYNQVKRIEAGRQLLIPLKPQPLGGLTVDGYQIVPILVYESILPSSSDAKTISAAAFHDQMDFLKKNGYSTTSLDQFKRFLRFEDVLPPKTVIITFDTARRWLYDTIYPILQQYGFTAALFIPTASIGKTGNMGWPELAELSAAGFDIGTVGRSRYSQIDKPNELAVEEWLSTVEKEIAGAKQIIESRLKTPCRYFAFPDGEANDMIISLLKQYSFTNAFTRKSGDNPFFSDDYKLQRIVVDDKMNREALLNRLAVFKSLDLR